MQILTFHFQCNQAVAGLLCHPVYFVWLPVRTEIKVSQINMCSQRTRYLPIENSLILYKKEDKNKGQESV